jgi:voltage-gated potassium channel
MALYLDFKTAFGSMGELLNVLQRLKIAGFAFLGILLIGTYGYYNIGAPETTLVDAFYMTGITISTIGFHEVIDMSNRPYGRLFTIFLAFSGFGVVTYFVSNLVALFIEGDIRRTFIKRNILRMIEELDNHYIICGIGRVGRNIALELHATQRPFVVADKEESIVEQFCENIPGTPFLSGDCTDDNFLIDLGIDRALGIFACASDDNTNLVICLTARQICANIRIVAVAKEVNHVKKLIRAGADRVVTPNYIGGLRMASEMLRPTVTNFLDEMLRSELNQRLEEFEIPERMDGQPLINFPSKDLDDTIVLAVRKEGKWQYNPKKDYVMSQGDHVVLLTTTEDRQILEKRLL